MDKQKKSFIYDRIIFFVISKLFRDAHQSHYEQFGILKAQVYIDKVL